MRGLSGFDEYSLLLPALLTNDVITEVKYYFPISIVIGDAACGAIIIQFRHPEEAYAAD